MARTTGRQDAFQITSEGPLCFSLMCRAGPVPGKDVERVEEEIKQFEMNLNIPPGDSQAQPLEAKNTGAFYYRVSMALLGGLALIAATLIIVLKNDLLTTLALTSVSTVILTGVLALFGLELKEEMVWPRWRRMLLFWLLSLDRVVERVIFKISN